MHSRLGLSYFTKNLNMKVHPIIAGRFKLDGGAMHGVVPKSLWSKINPADENNLCSWAMRSLLIEDGDRLILIDTGMGDKQSAKFFGHYHLHGNDDLDSELKRLGYHRDEITDVFLTHLHFDHCGGAIVYDNSKEHLVPAFKNATYWSNEKHWEWATHPNPREKASFLSENILPIQESGQLKWCGAGNEPFDHWEIFEANGHTEAQMIPIITYKGEKFAFCADLLPSVAHIPLAWTMAYDVRPLESMKEREIFLNRMVDQEVYLFFEHDYKNETANLKRTEKGVRLNETFNFSELFGN